MNNSWLKYPKTIWCHCIHAVIGMCCNFLKPCESHRHGFKYRAKDRLHGNSFHLLLSWVNGLCLLIENESLINYYSNIFLCVFNCNKIHSLYTWIFLPNRLWSYINLIVCLCVLTHSQLISRWIDHSCWLSWLIMRCHWRAGSIARASQPPPCPYASSTWTKAQTSTLTPNRSNWRKVFRSGRCWRLLRHTIQTDTCSRLLGITSHPLGSFAFLITFCVKTSTHFAVR